MKKRIIISLCLIVLLAVVAIIKANTKKTEEQHGKYE